MEGKGRGVGECNIMCLASHLPLDVAAYDKLLNCGKATPKCTIRTGIVLGFITYIAIAEGRSLPFI